MLPPTPSATPTALRSIPFSTAVLSIKTRFAILIGWKRWAEPVPSSDFQQVYTNFQDLLQVMQNTAISVAVCYQTVFVDESRMGPAVLNNNWTDVLPSSRDEISSLFKIKINRQITEDFNRSLAEANCSCTVYMV